MHLNAAPVSLQATQRPSTPRTSVDIVPANTADLLSRPRLSDRGCLIIAAQTCSRKRCASSATQAHTPHLHPTSSLMDPVAHVVRHLRSGERTSAITSSIRPVHDQRRAAITGGVIASGRACHSARLAGQSVFKLRCWNVQVDGADAHYTDVANPTSGDVAADEAQVCHRCRQKSMHRPRPHVRHTKHRESTKKLKEYSLACAQ